MKFPLLTGLLLLATPLVAQETRPLLQSNDRVAFVGNTLVERARLYGYLEASLQLAAGPEVKGLVFRNLGWSGDSVFGDARSYFGAPEEGRQRLARNLGEIKPTVVFLCYGSETATSVNQGWTDETAEGAAKISGSGLEASKALFLQGYADLIASVRTASGDSLREIVLVSPPPYENLGHALPDQTENNHNLATIRDGIRDLAKRSNARFIDLFAALGGDAFDGSVTENPLTEDGINYGETGHALVARE
ncbi:MAG TPA: SGNH/GDSL hydrolase family protein, partial [Bacteroidia bacterium]|nr:SGNH/GDSL hydrolase family protein [Bacteroidia bacterium]